MRQQISSKPLQRHLQSAALCDKGKVRAHNEDALLSLDQQQLWAVADGMGGHSFGALASSTCVNHLQHYRRSARSGINANRINQAIDCANRDLINTSRQQCGEIIGSTVVVLSVQAGDILCSWAGDSRAYRYRNSTLLQLNRDHNYAALLQDAGQLSADDPDEPAHQALTRGVGGEMNMHLEHCRYSLLPQDKFLICSDGLTKELSDQDIAEIFEHSSSSALSIVDALKKRFFSSRARDNVSIVALTEAPNESVP